MTLVKRGRFLFWLARELSRKYTRSLVAGIIIGGIAVFTVSRLWPKIQAELFMPVRRIAIVGEYTPSQLPDDVLSHLSVGLTGHSASGMPTPSLATSWEATDSGKTYVFTLDTSKIWHNGKTVTAADINYNIRDVTFTPLSNNKLKVTLPTAYSPFLLMVSKPLFLSGLVGLGDYKLEQINLKGDKVSSIRLVPLDGKKPVLEYKTYRTETSAITAYKLGDVDEVENLTAIDASFKQFPNTAVEKTTNYDRLVAVYFNLNESMLKEKSLRQALAYAVPDLPYERATSPISEQSWAYTPTVKRYTYDPKTAGKLLAPIKTSSLSAELTITTFSQYLDVAQQIAASWSLLGVKSTVRVENALPQKYEVLVSAYDIPLDPDQYALWHSKQLTTNITAYNTPKTDKLLEDARQEPDPEVRKKEYTEFQKKFMDDLPAIPLYYPPQYRLVRK
jgi:peptide/nickel transport system substrate-binding protein